MRKFLLTILATALLTSSAAAEGMTDGDRQRLLAHFDMTESWLRSEIDGLSDAQLRFRMTPESWSIMDVVEHLAIAEPQYWERVQNSMKQPPTTEKLAGTDAAILWYGIDRTRRTTTGEGARADRKVEGPQRIPGRIPEAPRDDERLREGDVGGPAIAENAGKGHRRLPVVPDDLDALPTPHPADPRGQSTRELPEELIARECSADGYYRTCLAKVLDCRRQGRTCAAEPARFRKVAGNDG
jgi:Protein of unknown function (DUF664)